MVNGQIFFVEIFIGKVIAQQSNLEIKLTPHSQKLSLQVYKSEKHLAQRLESLTHYNQKFAWLKQNE